jgi:Fic family protein
MTTEYSYRWKPLAPLADPATLGVPELRAFEQLWRKQKERLTAAGTYQPFWERLARSWSIETGIIERIYDLSAGATEVLIEHGFEANLIQHGDTDTKPERLIEILNDHRQGLGLVMDLIGGTRELTPGWIKELHALLCRHQPSVMAREQGPLQRMIEIPFEHGVYKTLPNSPTLADGRVHEYCPPEHVASEIEQMIAIYSDIPHALPEVRSAWLHLAFTQIHPFQDGNGRIARALASIDFIQVGLFPLVVDRRDRDSRYMPALQAADHGDLRPLIQFFAECEQRAIIQAISVAEEALVRVRGRQAAIEAARTKVLSRAQAEVNQRSAMAKRIDALAAAAHSVFESVAAEVQAAVPGVTTRTALSDGINAHYWTRQIVDMAKARRYWADMREHRAWSRLQLADGGVTDLVVTLHFVGNPSPGSCMSGAFLVHRDRADEPIATAGFTLLPQEPLVFVAEEDSEAQRERFLRWLDDVIVVALSEWKKRL